MQTIAKMQANTTARRAVKTNAAKQVNAASLKTSDARTYLESLPGITAPMGVFDPANLTADKSVAEIKRYREAEITHGRVCMLASTGIIVAENYNPLFGGSITGTAVNQFQQVPQPFWEIIALTIGIAEAYRVAKGWEDPNKGIFTLRDTYSPGDVGYDPLGIRPENEVELFDLQTKELNNGRLAMIATLAMVVQEEVSKLPIFAELEGGYVADESFLPGAPGIAF